jgi:hypothetical protein
MRPAPTIGGGVTDSSRAGCFQLEKPLILVSIRNASLRCNRYYEATYGSKLLSPSSKGELNLHVNETLRGQFVLSDFQ